MFTIKSVKTYNENDNGLQEILNANPDYIPPRSFSIDWCVAQDYDHSSDLGSLVKTIAQIFDPSETLEYKLVDANENDIKPIVVTK